MVVEEELAQELGPVLGPQVAVVLKLVTLLDSLRGGGRVRKVTYPDISAQL